MCDMQNKNTLYEEQISELKKKEFEDIKFQIEYNKYFIEMRETYEEILKLQITIKDQKKILKKLNRKIKSFEFPKKPIFITISNDLFNKFPCGMFDKVGYMIYMTLNDISVLKELKNEHFLIPSKMPKYTLKENVYQNVLKLEFSNNREYDDVIFHLRRFLKLTDENILLSDYLKFNEITISYETRKLVFSSTCEK